MIKKNLNILIISITMITVLIMILIFHFSKGIIESKDEKTLILNDKSNNKNQDYLNNDIIKNDVGEEGIKNNENLGALNDSNNRTIDNEDSKNLESKNKTEDNNSYMDNKKNIREIQNKDYISVFKISKEKIPDNLTVSDKIKIFSISKNLSPNDLNKLQNDINNNNEKKGVSDAMYLLKTKLDSKDFNIIKDIASKFIDLDSVNN